MRPICKICGSNKTSFRFNGIQDKSEFSKSDRYEMFSCNDCKSLFKSYDLNFEKLNFHYKNQKIVQTGWDKPQELLPHETRILDFIKKYQPRNILDIGCFTGNLLSKVEGEHNLYGIELNIAAQKIASKKGIEIIGSDLYEIESCKMKFDLIIMIDVAEHIQNAKSTFQKVLNKLNDNGHLIVITGNILSFPFRFFKSKYWYYRYPDHISFYSENTFKKLFYQNASKLTFEKSRHYLLTMKNILNTLKSFVKVFLLNREFFFHSSIFKDHLICIVKK